MPIVHSDKFVDMIGMNAHLNFADEVYTANPGWRDLFLDMGIRHFRSSIGTLAGATADLKYLYNNSPANEKCKALILINPRTTGTPVPQYSIANANAFIEHIRTQGMATMVSGFEGANEPTNGAGVDWEDRVFALQQAIWNNVKNAAASIRLDHLPVIGPSMYKRTKTAYDYLAAQTTIEALADIANLHNYTGGLRPSQGQRTEGGPTGLDNGDITSPLALATIMADAQVLAPGKPMWVTETGYDLRSDPALRTAQLVSPNMSAKYGLRMMGEYFRVGIERAYWYLFADEPVNDPGWEFGVMWSDGVNLSPRPSYYAFQRLIAKMKDPGSAYTPVDLAYSVTGANLADVKHIGFGKRDGSYIIMIWLDAVSWQRSAPVGELNIAPRAVTLNLPANKKAIQYLPTFSATATTLADSSSSISLSVPDEIMLIELLPPVAPGVTVVARPQIPFDPTTTAAEVVDRVNEHSVALDRAEASEARFVPLAATDYGTIAAGGTVTRTYTIPAVAPSGVTWTYAVVNVTLRSGGSRRIMLSASLTDATTLVVSASNPTAAGIAFNASLMAEIYLVTSTVTPPAGV